METSKRKRQLTSSKSKQIADIIAFEKHYQIKWNPYRREEILQEVEEIDHQKDENRKIRYLRTYFHTHQFEDATAPSFQDYYQSRIRKPPPIPTANFALADPCFSPFPSGTDKNPVTRTHYFAHPNDRRLSMDIVQVVGDVPEPIGVAKAIIIEDMDSDDDINIADVSIHLTSRSSKKSKKEVKTQTFFRRKAEKQEMAKIARSKTTEMGSSKNATPPVTTKRSKVMTQKSSAAVDSFDSNDELVEETRNIIKTVDLNGGTSSPAPFSMTEIMARIQQVIGPPPGSTPEASATTSSTAELPLEQWKQVLSKVINSPIDQIFGPELGDFKTALEIFMKSDGSGLTKADRRVVYQFLIGLPYHSQSFKRSQEDLREYNQWVQDKTHKER